jgi:hypothetical protein
MSLFLMLTGVAGRLNEMPEVEREQILAQRQEQMQSRTDKFNLSKLLAAQDIGGSMADDSVAQAAKRAFVLLHPYHLTFHNMTLYASALPF